MKKLINIFIAFLAVLSMAFVWLYVKRVTLPYNSEGSYFDPEESVVYHQQAADVIGLIALVLIILTVVLFIIRKKSK